MSTMNRSHFFPSSGDGVKQDRAGYAGRLTERQASQESRELGASVFVLGVMSTLLESGKPTRIPPGGKVKAPRRGGGIE